jgi:hypothetical protein
MPSFSALALRKQALFRTSCYVAVLLVASAVRLYKIDSPLWLDEIFGYHLARLGLGAVIQNSWTDPHPPFHYLLQWVIHSVGYSQSEIAWRWISFSSGVLAVAVIGSLVRQIAGFSTSLLVALIAATLPSLVYFSQEARGVAPLVLLASLSMWLTAAMLRDGSPSRLWIAWTVTSLLGLYTEYSYLMVAGTQLAFLGLFNHRRVAWWLASIIVIGGLALLLPFMSGSLVNFNLHYASAEALTFWRTMQSMLAGEPLRYGFSPTHTVFPLVVLGLCMAAAVRTFRLGDNRLVYYVLQVALPMGLFFAFGPVLGIGLPLHQTKQFLALMPALLVLMAAGLAELSHWLGARSGLLVAIVLCGALLVLNALGLQAYWTNPKSPEGLAVLKLGDYRQPGEKVVSLHYATNYALEYYTSGLPVYIDPEPEGEAYRYRLTESGRILDLPAASPGQSGTGEIRASGKFWVLAHAALYREPMASLTSGCQILAQETFPARNTSFELIKVECPPDG